MSRRRSLDELREELAPEYELKRVLGEGSSATVYLAWDRELAMSVAVKVLLPDKLADSDAVRRFVREGRAAARLRSDYIASVKRLDRLRDGTPYLVMEYVKGRTMADRLQAEGPLSPEAALTVLKQVASALAVAHARDIVHRDVQPSNVLWDADEERALLIDFGFAQLLTVSGQDITRMTWSGEWTEDVWYLTPEQLDDEPLTVFADIYLFGVMAYELLTGTGPYEAETNADRIKAHLRGVPRDLGRLCPDLGRDVADVLRRCLNKSPLQRPAAADVLRGLEGDWVPERRRWWEALKDAEFRLTVGWGSVIAGFIIGSTATLDEQYDWIPEWAFTEALVTGAAIFLVAIVLAAYGLETRLGNPRRGRSALLVTIGVGWTVATRLVYAILG